MVGSAIIYKIVDVIVGLRAHLEQLLSKRYQLFRRQPAMTLIHGLGQRVGYPRANPHHGRLLDSELHGDRVGGLEADAADITRQPIRIFRHDLDGIRTVGLVNTDCPCRTNPMAVQEDHDLAHDLLLSPGIGDALGADRANTRHLAQAIRLSLDRVKHLLAESTHKLFCVDRADASDHAGAQVFLDTVDRRRCGGAQEARLELLAMGMVVDPFAGCSDPLTSRNGRGMPNDRY